VPPKGAPLNRGAPCHGIIGILVNPALTTTMTTTTMTTTTTTSRLLLQLLLLQLLRLWLQQQQLLLPLPLLLPPPLLQLLHITCAACVVVVVYTYLDHPVMLAAAADVDSVTLSLPRSLTLSASRPSTVAITHRHMRNDRLYRMQIAATALLNLDIQGGSE